MRPLLLALAFSVVASAQPAPASDYGDLMDTRFFPLRGDFLFDSPGAEFLLFPPADLGPDTEAMVLIHDANGELLGGQRIGTIGTTGSAAIATLGWRGGPEWRGPVQDGERYTLDLVLDGQVIGRVPFTAAAVQSGDPYNPGTSYILEGPWRTHAYFRHETDRPEYLMYLDAWIGPDETGSNVKTEVSIRRNGQEVAWGSGFTNMTHGWGLVEFRLYDAGTRDHLGRFGRAVPNATSWTIQDVTPGTYEVVFSDEDGPFRTMTTEGGDGAFVPHPRSALDYEPRAYFLTTRRMSGQNLDRNSTLYWIAPDAGE